MYCINEVRLAHMGNPPPSKRTILALLNVPRAGAGAFVVRSQDGCSQKSEPGYRSPLPHPTRRRSCAPPSPLWGGSAGDISGRPARDAGPDHALHPHHPMHRTVGLSPGGGAAEENPAGPFPVPPRRGAGALVVRFHEGCGRKRGASRRFSRMQKPTVFYGVRAIICITDME